MLEGLEEGLNLRELAAALAEELNHPVERVLDDIADFIIQLRQRGLIEFERVSADRLSHSRSIRRDPSDTPLSRERLHPELLPRLAPLTLFEKLRLILEILNIYTLTRWRLSSSDVEILNEIPSPPSRRTAVVPSGQTAAVAIRLGEVVTQTLARIPKDARCLIRAIVLLRVLSRRGIGARLVIGVNHEDEPFTAHAWVEHRGIALLDQGGERFARLLEIDA